MSVSPSLSPSDSACDSPLTAFRARSFENHPDLETDAKKKEAANKKFRGILESYQVLRDPKKRAVYDRSL
jgi:DnaJ-class molecular chaperone